MLEKQARKQMDLLATSALLIAQTRHQRHANVAHVLCALYRDPGLVGVMLHDAGVTPGEIDELMDALPNSELTAGDTTTLSISCRRVLGANTAGHALDKVEVLRHTQHNVDIDAMLAKHGLKNPANQPLPEQVLAAAEKGASLRLAPPMLTVDFLGRVRLMLEAAMNADPYTNLR